MKTKTLREMSNIDQEKKIKELKLELIKSKINASKTGSLKTKEIKRTIAKLLTISKDNSQK
ncbi:MAG: 50S ribosomal protein L29 [Nanoarchaeota archaeon]|nr:50S ribosomal protein L29 [Nanoarchaeota archaeon]